MKKIFIINFLTFFLIYFLLKTNISFGEKTSVICKNNPPFIADIYYKWADSVLTSMTLEEKIGQLFMIDAYSAKDNTDKERIIKYITKYKIGGLIFFKGSPKRQAILTNLYQSLSKIPLLIGIDAEYGLAMRLDSTIRYPDQMMLAAIDDDKLIYEMGRDIALQCKRLGIHINFLLLSILTTIRKIRLLTFVRLVKINSKLPILDMHICQDFRIMGFLL